MRAEGSAAVGKRMTGDDEEDSGMLLFCFECIGTRRGGYFLGYIFGSTWFMDHGHVMCRACFGYNLAGRLDQCYSGVLG